MPPIAPMKMILKEQLKKVWCFETTRQPEAACQDFSSIDLENFEAKPINAFEDEDVCKTVWFRGGDGRSAGITDTLMNFQWQYVSGKKSEIYGSEQYRNVAKEHPVDLTQQITKVMHKCQSEYIARISFFGPETVLEVVEILSDDYDW